MKSKQEGQTAIEQKVLELARQVAEEHRVEVVGVSLSGSRNRMVLRVTIDKEDGVTLNDCTDFSRALDSLLEVEDPVEGTYSLEISSPGLDRPLATLRDFERNIGKLVRIVTIDRIDGQSFFLGRISSVDGNLIKLSVDKKERQIPIESISRARLEIELK